MRQERQAESAEGMRKLASAFWTRLLTDAVNAEAIRRGWPVDWARSKVPAKVRATQAYALILEWLTDDAADDSRHAMSTFAGVSVRHILAAVRSIPDLDDDTLRAARYEAARCLAARRVPASSVDTPRRANADDAGTIPRRTTARTRRGAARRQSVDTAANTADGGSRC